MTGLQEHETTWTRADAILEQSPNANTKFFALQVLDGVIKYRWNALPTAGPYSAASLTASHQYDKVRQTT
jgi:hypothetical protein